MRPLSLVIDAIVKIIPDDYDCKTAIKNDLMAVRGSIPYTAPEAMPYRWEEVAEILSYSIGTPDTEWKEKIALLFAAKLDFREVLNG